MIAFSPNGANADQSELVFAAYERDDYPSEIEHLKSIARERYSPPGWLRTLASGCLAIGALGLVGGLIAAPARTWGTMAANLLFWGSLSQGAIVAACVFNAGFGRWARPIQRIVECLGVFLPFLPVCYLLVWLGRGSVYAWTHEPGRSPWLSGDWMLVRDEIVLVFMGAISLWWLYWSIRPDLALWRGNAKSSWLTEALSRDWRGDEQERSRSQSVLRLLAPALIIVYTLAYGLLDIDLGMSVDSHFKSTMYPGIYWLAGFLSAVAFSAILVRVWRNCDERIRELITPSQHLDLGNLIWSFAIFRTWWDWSQYIIVWYGNIPDESRYLIERWRISPWSALAYLSLWLMFIAPFFLGFSRRLKRTSLTLAWFGGLVASGLWLRQVVEILPGIHPLGPNDFGLIEISVSVGWLGALLLPYLWVTARIPLFPIADPIFDLALETRGVPET